MAQQLGPAGSSFVRRMRQWFRRDLDLPWTENLQNRAAQIGARADQIMAERQRLLEGKLPDQAGQGQGQGNP